MTKTETLLTAREVRVNIPVSDRTISRWIREGEFPRPVKVKNQNFWFADEIDAWLAERSAARTAA